jgi:hypothetical protein
MAHSPPLVALTVLIPVLGRRFPVSSPVIFLFWACYFPALARFLGYFSIT